MGHASQLHVDPSNLEQARAWDGGEGEYWARHAEGFENTLRAYDPAFLDMAAVRPHDRVLDVGCGTGATSRQVAHRASQGSVLGIDLSAAMIEVARQHAADHGLDNLRFEQADAQVHELEPASFDLAVSRTGTMFFGDPPAAFANIARALRPGGRLVQLVWQPLSENEWLATQLSTLADGRELPPPPSDAPSPFALSDSARLRSLLLGAGFGEPVVTGVREPMWFGASADAATDLVAGLMGWMLADLDADRRVRVLANLRQLMVDHTVPGGVEFGSATWLVSAARRT